MLKFIQEQDGSKNLHMEHIEDQILDFIQIGRASINFLKFERYENSDDRLST